MSSRSRPSLVLDGPGDAVRRERARQDGVAPARGAAARREGLLHPGKSTRASGRPHRRLSPAHPVPHFRRTSAPRRARSSTRSRSRPTSRPSCTTAPRRLEPFVVCCEHSRPGGRRPDHVWRLPGHVHLPFEQRRSQEAQAAAAGGMTAACNVRSDARWSAWTTFCKRRLEHALSHSLTAAERGLCFRDLLD